jgi:Co/Zn/Cd efflux system component
MSALGQSTTELAQSTSGALKRAVACVAALNICYFAFELTVAQRIGSVSLFADSIDFLEDATVNGLILLALPWSPRRRGTVGVLLAGILLLPGLATAWTAWGKFALPVPPEASRPIEGRASNHLSTSPSLRRVPVAVEQAINEGAERRLRVTTI